MAARSLSRTLRPLARQLPVIQRRTLISASTCARPGLQAALKPTASTSLQQSRGLKQIDFAGTEETVYGMAVSRARVKQNLTTSQNARIGLGKSYWYVLTAQNTPIEASEPMKCYGLSDEEYRSISRMIHLH